MKLRRGEILLVEWLDQSYYNGPGEAEGATQECYGHTLGYFLEGNDKWLCVAMERFVTSQECFRHIVTFPMCAVTKIKRIKEVK